MKRYLILIIIVIIAITSIGYLYLNIQSSSNTIYALNKPYEELKNEIINGNNLATYINKIIDKNAKNNVKKDEKGYYIDNNNNSIIAEIKFKDSDNIFRIEQIENNDINKFINLYSNINFKCTEIQYHNETKLVSFLHFEEV